ncbi:MAG TPA: hypothetical protein VJ278_06050, partial [Chthoniobacterales bacterium]|nr:hypothetical protein [Chthoniobacterales bacterium]
APGPLAEKSLPSGGVVARLKNFEYAFVACHPEARRRRLGQNPGTNHRRMMTTLERAEMFLSPSIARLIEVTRLRARAS